MKIEITLDHTDLIGTNAETFGALMYVLQGLAKSNVMLGGVKPFTEPRPQYVDQKTAFKLDALEKEAADKIADTLAKESVKTVEKEKPVNTIDRKSVITEIKKIVANTDKSATVRAYIDSHFGVKKLDMLTDEQLADVLRLVKQE